MSQLIVRKLEVSTGDENLRRLLNPVSIDFSMGEVLGIYGPNGSGKSTFLRALSGGNYGLKVSGEIWIDQFAITQSVRADARASVVVYLGSDFHSPFSLTVRDLLEMGNGFSATPSHSRISEVIEALKINEFMPRVLNTLSDGERQLVMFARCLIQFPKVLILDETFSKLDLDRLMLVGRVMRQWCERGMTFLVASHDLNFLSEVSDQMMLLKKGELLAMAQVHEVMTPHFLGELYPGVPLQVVRSPESGKLKILY